MVDTSGTTTYSYDDLYRLTDVTYPNSDAQTYEYDPMGNRTAKTHNSVPTGYSYDDADQMTLAGGVAYDYDDNGNQIEAGTDTFEWDAENRLVETNIASTTGTYDYNGDGDGLRITRTIGASAVSYVWDLNASLPVILQDTDGNRYVYGLDLLTRIDGIDEEWHLYDGLGSTTGLADETGAVAGTYTYDVFGAVRAHTGEQNDPTELEYLRARYYDAVTGRFLAQDPIPFLNRYLYVGNNPVSFVDPSGACRVSVGSRPVRAIGGLFSRLASHAYRYGRSNNERVPCIRGRSERRFNSDPPRRQTSGGGSTVRKWRARGGRLPQNRRRGVLR